MANEFRTRTLTCTPNQLIPNGPSTLGYRAVSRVHPPPTNDRPRSTEWRTCHRSLADWGTFTRADRGIAASSHFAFA